MMQLALSLRFCGAWIAAMRVPITKLIANARATPWIACSLADGPLAVKVNSAGVVCAQSAQPKVLKRDLLDLCLHA